MSPEVLEAYAAEFDRCAPFIAPAIEAYSFGNHDIEDIKAFVLAGKMQLWPAERSAIITEVINHPARTQCHVAYAGGDISELKEMAPQIKEWAISRGCDHWTCAGREGWARALGFGKKACAYFREDF